MNKHVVFRVDASVKIGTGHIMRCLTLANMLKKEGMSVSFICRKSEGDMNQFIQQQGYCLFELKDSCDQDDKETIKHLKNANCDLLIIDHYNISLTWEEKLQAAFPSMKLMIIDDLANRKHNCDILLDQNYLKNFQNRYKNLVFEECRLLLGPQYLLLRPEFYKENFKVHNDKVKDILVFYGGSDPTNETIKALDALEMIDTLDFNVHIVVGLSNRFKEIIKEKCREKGYHYYIQIDYLADLMRRADLALGAGGVTMWERCFLGLPSIVTTVAENQIQTTIDAAEYGAVWNIGWHEEVKATDLFLKINEVLNSPIELKKMREKAKKLMNTEALFSVHPVVKAIMEEIQ